MVEPDNTSELTREVKSQLDGMIVGIELTLISIVQGLALSVLAGSAVEPLIKLQVEYWPAIIVGALAILIFWSRSLIHTLSFIGWPLEFGHNFIYFISTLIEVTFLTQIGNPLTWFALQSVYFVIAWFLYLYDLRVVYKHHYDFETVSERKLYDDIVADQLLNVRFLMPAGVVYNLAAWWLVHQWPDLFLEQQWHVALSLLSVVVGLIYLWDGMIILKRRQNWIVARYVQERREPLENGE